MSAIPAVGYPPKILDSHGAISAMARALKPLGDGELASRDARLAAYRRLAIDPPDLARLDLFASTAERWRRELWAPKRPAAHVRRAAPNGRVLDSLHWRRA